jgi:hypothetical protein
MTIKNSLSPQSVYGPFKQTLFLGCSVGSFSTTVGWGGQVSELTVQIVPDHSTSAEGKEYYDASLTKKSWYAADPGYTYGFVGDNYEIIGCPVYFRVADFEFSGIIQSWEQSRGDSSNPIYIVKVIDPRQILEGTQLIINDYAGGVANIANVGNVYGFWEQYGFLCPQLSLSSLPAYHTSYTAGDVAPDGAMFGTPANYWGAAEVNKNGMQWDKIRYAINLMFSAYPKNTSVYSPYGRLLYRGVASGAIAQLDGCGLLANDTGISTEYSIDLSELPTMPYYWRLNGDTISLLNAINEICDTANFDYYVELIPIKDAIFPGSVGKVIKIRTASKYAQPSLTALNTWISNNTVGANQTTRGKELRTEPSSTFIIGGKKESVYQLEIDDDDLLLPFYGFDDYGNALIPTKDANGYWVIQAPIIPLALQFKVIKTDATGVLINELEMQHAMSGFDSWMAHISSNNTHTYQLTLQTSKAYRGVWNKTNELLPAIDDAKQNGLNEAASRDFVSKFGNNLSPSNMIGFELIQEDIQNIFSFVSKYATTYYGRQFQIRLPFSCVRRDAESFQTFISETPTENGYSEQVSIIGVANPSYIIDFMSTPDRKIGAFVRFDNADRINLSNMNPDRYITIDNKMYFKCQVVEGVCFSDWQTLANPRAVIDLGERVRKLPDVVTPEDNGLLVSAMDKYGEENGESEELRDKRVNFIATSLSNVCNKNMFGPLVYPSVIPNAIAIGLRSNILTYGPWGVVGNPGATTIIHDDGLVPWEYGSIELMNEAANQLAQQGLAYAHINEMGNITVAGYPTILLGAEINSTASLVESRSKTLVPYNTSDWNNALTLPTGTPFNPHTVGSFTAAGLSTNYLEYSSSGSTGVYGPNITSINVDVGTNGVKTSYALRTYTTKFGTFSKSNSERLKTASSVDYRIQKTMRSWGMIRARYRDNIND